MSKLSNAGLHVAIIMDGNGRWAAARGLPRTAGHRAGADAVKRTIEAAPELGISTLTLFAFSSDNWNRPAREVETLMQLLLSYLRRETSKCARHGIRLSFFGCRQRLSKPLARAMRSAEVTTRKGRSLHLRIAVDYSARDAILRAAREASQVGEVCRESFARLLTGDDETVSEVDLLIRTGGEQRLSDFLLWECAYAELYFTKRMWPDFQKADLIAAIREFRNRDRRFGQIGEAAAG